MHIFYLSHRVPYPADKGEKIRTFHQIKYLVEQGHQITVFAPLENIAEQLFANDLQHKLGVQVNTAMLGSALLRKVSALLSGQPVSQTHFYCQPLLALLQQAIKTAPPDAIVCTSSAMAVYLEKSGLLTGNQPRSTLLMDFMDLDSDKWQQYANTASYPMKWVYQREATLVAKAEKSIYRQFDHCFFISENEVQLFAKQTGNADKVSVLANGLDTSVFYPPCIAPQADSPVFLFTGVMNYKPNEDAVLWFALSMWPKIKEAYADARFIIAGMQPSSRIQQLEKIPGIEVTGYVDDILPFYHQASIFVAPFRLARGVQNKILQAMACGLPIVTTPLGAEGINCEPGVHLLTASTAEAFIESVKYLQSNKRLQLTMQSKARELIQTHYSWDSVLQKLPVMLQHRQDIT